MGESISDVRFRELTAAGFGPGSITDMERKRLLAKLGLSGPQNLSMADLYARATEEPWPFVGFSPVAASLNLSDNFARANSVSNLGATSVGGKTWVQSVGVFGIDTGKAYASTVSSTGGAAVDTTVNPAAHAGVNVEVGVILSRPTSFVGRYPLVYLGSPDGSQTNAFRFYVNGADGTSATIQDGTGGATTSGVIAIPNNAKLSLRANKASGGNMLLSGRVNDVEVVSATYPQRVGTYVGFGTGFTNDGDIRFDDFTFVVG